MQITILGNGQSRDKWDQSGDLCISCNVLHKACSMLCTLHLNHYGWTSTPTITGVHRVQDWLVHLNHCPSEVEFKEQDEEGCYRVRNLWVEGLRVFYPWGAGYDSGQIAVIWAHCTYPSAQINLWGFDSLWGDLSHADSELITPLPRWKAESRQPWFTQPWIRVHGMSS